MGSSDSTVNYNYETDEYGRTVKASGYLVMENGERDLDAQRSVGGEYRRETDDGGHLIGSRFGGAGEEINLIAQDMHLNRSGYKRMENHWAKELEEGKEVYVEVEAIYQDGVSRPYSMLIKEEVRDGEKIVTDYWSFTNENLETEEFEIEDEDEE